MAEHRRYVTRPITAADIDAGTVRISQSERSTLPDQPSEIELVLKGRRLGPRRYDPREDANGRTARVRVGPESARALLHENEELPITVSRSGTVYIGDRGSRLRICDWVNDRPDELGARIVSESRTLGDFATAPLEWISPLRAEQHAELADNLWSRLELDDPTPAADGFWPVGGPNWDAVASVPGKSDQRGIVLVEAKSHINELKSSCGATNPTSRATIERSLAETKEYLGVLASANWLTPYYQAANRHAFLYYLRERRKIPTWLVFVYFVGDDFEVEGVSQPCPQDEAGWGQALEEMHSALALPPSHPLTPFVHEVFVPVVN